MIFDGVARHPLTMGETNNRVPNIPQGGALPVTTSGCERVRLLENLVDSNESHYNQAHLRRGLREFWVSPSTTGPSGSPLVEVGTPKFPLPDIVGFVEARGVLDPER